jgi:hypothetical protein
MFTILGGGTAVGTTAALDVAVLLLLPSSSSMGGDDAVEEECESDEVDDGETSDDMASMSDVVGCDCAILYAFARTILRDNSSGKEKKQVENESSDEWCFVLERNLSLFSLCAIRTLVYRSSRLVLCCCLSESITSKYILEIQCNIYNV